MTLVSNISAPLPFLPEPGKPTMKWKNWFRAFENYLIAIDGKQYEPERKKAIMFGLLGAAGQEVFDSLPEYEPPSGQFIPLDEYKESVKRLEKQFGEEPNIMIGRHRFAMRKQQEGESIEDYIACLRVLASKCDYNEMVDVYIRDQFVFHCFEKKVQERLLSCKNPTLEECIDIAKGIERSIESSREIAATGVQKSNVYAIQNRKSYTQQNETKNSYAVISKNVVCFRCGSKYHKADCTNCPAIGKRCTKCSKYGHFAGVCKNSKPTTSKNLKVNAIEDFDEELCSKIVLTLGDTTSACKGPLGIAHIGDVEVNIMADSGSPITIISELKYVKH